MKRVAGLLFAIAYFSTLASADIQISYSIDYGASVLCGPSVGLVVTCWNIENSPITITSLTATTNSPGLTTNADATSAAARLENNTGAAHVLQLWVAATDYTDPSDRALSTLFSAVGRTVFVGAEGSSLNYFVGCVDQTNSYAPCSGTYSTTPLTLDIEIPGSYGGFNMALVPTLTAPYSMGQYFAFTLGAGEKANFSASTSLNASVPEPSSIALLGAAVLFTGLLVHRKNRLS